MMGKHANSFLSTSLVILIPLFLFIQSSCKQGKMDLVSDSKALIAGKPESAGMSSERLGRIFMNEISIM